MARCEWETDELLRNMMVVIQNVHEKQRDKDDVGSLFNQVKFGVTMGGSIEYVDGYIVFSEESKRIPVINGISKFYNVADKLFDMSLHSTDITWCLYRSGPMWDNFEIGDTRISPIYLSASTSIDFVSLWREEVGNVIFKILAPGDTKILAIESIYNPKFDIVTDTDYEYEITLPPGIMTIIDKTYIYLNNIQRLFVTVQFEQITKEQALYILENIGAYEDPE